MIARACLFYTHNLHTFVHAIVITIYKIAFLYDHNHKIKEQVIKFWISILHSLTRLHYNNIITTIDVSSATHPFKNMSTICFHQRRLLLVSTPCRELLLTNTTTSLNSSNTIFQKQLSYNGIDRSSHPLFFLRNFYSLSQKKERDREKESLRLLLLVVLRFHQLYKMASSADDAGMALAHMHMYTQAIQQWRQVHIHKEK